MQENKLQVVRSKNVVVEKPINYGYENDGQEVTLLEPNFSDGCIYVSDLLSHQLSFDFREIGAKVRDENAPKVKDAPWYLGFMRVSIQEI